MILEEIVERIAPGGRLLRTWPLKGGMVAEMTAVEFEASDGRIRRIVVRRPSSLNELRILQLTQAAGLPVPAPHFLVESEAELVLVVDFVAGEIDFGLADVKDYMHQMADHLAAIHSLDLMAVKSTTIDVSFLPVRESGCWEIDRVDDRWTGAGFDVGQAVALMRQSPLIEANAPRLLHGDFWAGNMLWQDGTLTAVIDWEDAALGDPLKDLAEARVEIAWLFGASAVEAFTDYYRAKMSLDYTDLAYWDLCAVLRLWRLTKGNWGWLVDFVGDYGRDDITEQTIWESYGAFVEQVFMLLGKG